MIQESSNGQAALQLMVSQAEEPVRIQLFQHGKGAVPIGVVASRVHKVPGLDGQVQALYTHLFQDPAQVLVVAFLQVSQYQGLDTSVFIAGCKAPHGGPMGPVAHPVIVGRAGGQALGRHAAGVGCGVVAEAGKLAGTGNGLCPFHRFLLFRQLQQRLAIRIQRV